MLHQLSTFPLLRCHIVERMERVAGICVWRMRERTFMCDISIKSYFKDQSFVFRTDEDTSGIHIHRLEIGIPGVNLSTFKVFADALLFSHSIHLMEIHSSSL